ncbi:molybdopterin-dependent oxidoreductase [Haloferula sp.]|uniref:molybdopterin-dependent oxidoreductase n=1 Tax=Haloferula sp. TaxID=2497595 RepID=UPI00329DDBD5
MSENASTAEERLPKDLAAEKGLVNVQIDGVWRQVPKGTRMIEACRMFAVDVPHYCYHPKLSSPGNCRMCLVQMGMPPRPTPGQDPSYDDGGFQKIGWMPRPVIACANTVGENMGIRTSGELVEKCREGVMEFLLINHPLDCPICDQAGECRLQEQSVGYGRGTSRFVDMKIKKPKNVDIGKNIRLDDERCIMCSRCIRFMDEVADDPVLGFTQRGTHTTLTVHPGRRLDHNYALNTADICPVGALTSNDFRFDMRVWFLKETKTIDVNCGTGANITVWTRNNTIYRITPRQNDDVNSCWMPDSHRLNFHYIDSEQRLNEPMIKQDGKHAPATWSEAIDRTVEGLRQFEPGEVAIIASGRMTNEELYLVKALAGDLDVEHLTIVPRVEENDGMLISADRNPNSTGAKLVWRREDPAFRLNEIRDGVRSGSIKALLVLGEDLTAEVGFSADELAKPEFIATLQLLAGATAEASDVILPAAAFSEKRGSMVNVTGRLQRLNQATELIGQARNDWEILRDLICKVIGKSSSEEDFPHQIEDIFKDMANSVSDFEGLTLSKIGDQGKVVTETGVTIPLLENERARKAAGEIVG